MLRKIIPHLVIVITLIMAVLIVIDFMNDAMGFLRGGEFKTLLIIYCIVSAVSAAYLIASNSERRKRMIKRKRNAGRISDDNK